MQGKQAIEKLIKDRDGEEDGTISTQGEGGRGDSRVQSRCSPSNTLDWFVWDANIPPTKTYNMLNAALPLMRKGSRFVITLKNTCKTKQMFKEEVSAIITELSSFANEVEETHLVSNTTRETTISGRLVKGRAIPDPSFLDDCLP